MRLSTYYSHMFVNDIQNRRCRQHKGNSDSICGLSTFHYFTHTLQVIPVSGRFSAARFIRPWINKLVSDGYTGTLNVNGMNFTASDIKEALRSAINNASDQVLSLGEITNDNLRQLFGNPTRLPDGSAMYGIVINTLGVAVNGFPINIPIEGRAQHIIIKNVEIGRINLAAVDRPVLSVDGKKPSTDAVGAILETEDGFTLTPGGTYLGNPVGNAQLIVAKAIHENFTFNPLDTGRNNILPEIVAWAESGLPYLNADLEYICNGDTMFHVNKGIVAFRLDAANDIECHNCSIREAKNSGNIGSTACNSNQAYKQGIGKSHLEATYPGYNGGDCRGFSLSSSSNAHLSNCQAINIQARAGDAIGFDIIHGSSNITLSYPVIETVLGGIGYSPLDYVENPTPLPRSVQINIDDSTSHIQVY
eukprot:TRINITY_DN972_c0_g1_i2.p1 TRINITY_DN972_c0_g1~~TRINITY_DN972_c0_g1_i2.p1  ORF type:complete len:419 (+),score=26.91 TRINITY_DN972_c0_g1_i2:910-2166(+)